MHRPLVLLAAALALALAGCGDDEEAGSGAATATPAATETAAPAEPAAGGEPLALAAPEDGSLVFEPAELTAAAGTITIEFTNPATVPHAVAVEGGGTDVASDVVTESESTLTVELEPGEYPFYCPVGNHRAAGMEGTLTVE